MSNNTMSYATKIEARRARLEAAADRAEVRADAAYKRADLREEASGIPFGQPILVGHHSEARHRRAIEKANRAMQTCIKERDRADALRAKATAVGTGGISADDPEAVSKLTEQLRAAQATQVLMKTANALVRKGDRDGLVKLGLSAADIEELFTPPFGGRPGYQLHHNRANIARIEKRIAALTAASKREMKSHVLDDGTTVIENAEMNRIQIVFPGKPDAQARAELKAHGFRWVPTVGAWQRQLNNAGIHAAQRVIASLGLSWPA